MEEILAKTDSIPVAHENPNGVAVRRLDQGEMEEFVYSSQDIEIENEPEGYDIGGYQLEDETNNDILSRRYEKCLFEFVARSSQTEDWSPISGRQVLEEEDELWWRWCAVNFRRMGVNVSGRKRKVKVNIVPDNPVGPAPGDMILPHSLGYWSWSQGSGPYAPTEHRIANRFGHTLDVEFGGDFGVGLFGTGAPIQGEDVDEDQDADSSFVYGGPVSWMERVGQVDEDVVPIG
ncbi:uncharacterized protein PAC_07621 [Phialocephala subalpina]|uniref:Uncharacterized protein n=1 Tax=Phialocephala subalpina TaxID=576137 RepID=A0A1L7WY78_9HELO|nr:uncharacterized protein PAC_07621 [Phialocephala subalpina]